MRVDEKPEPRQWRGLLAGGLVAVVLVALLIYGALRMMANSTLAPPPRQQKIVVMPQHEPPPPPPPKDEPPPPPEPEKIEQQLPEEQPPPEAPPESDEPPPGDDLGVDAEGSGTGDGFGLVGKKGGRGLIGGGGDRNRWFAGEVQQDLQRQLADNDEVRGAKYRVEIKLWFTSDGRVERFELQGTTGDARSTAALRQVVEHLKASHSPPESMQQPMKLRIVSR